MTPWGDASSLRDRRLPPGRGRPADEVQQNQRERLFAAMVALCSEKGYAATSIGDLVELSGVSSRSFYELFPSKEECFLATLDEVLAKLRRSVVAGFGEGGGGGNSLEDTATTLSEQLVVQQAAARLWLVESFSAGERAQQRIDTTLAAMAGVLHSLLAASPGRKSMPTELSRAILGGVAGVLYHRLAEDEAEAIPELAPALGKWALGIPPPPRPLRARGRRPEAGTDGVPPFAAHVPGERVLRGFAAAVAEKGYAATTIADIAARAKISQNTFYAHFRDKDDVLHAALDSSGAQMVAAVLPAVRRSPEWPGALRVALDALCGFLSAEPAFAYLREVEAYAVGPAAVAQRDRARDEIVEMLVALGGLPASPQSLATEATLAAIQSLLYERVRQGGSGRLAEVVPLATYLALAPTLGAEAAWEGAMG